MLGVGVGVFFLEKKWNHWIPKERTRGNRNNSFLNPQNFYDNLSDIISAISTLLSFLFSPSLSPAPLLKVHSPSLSLSLEHSSSPSLPGQLLLIFPPSAPGNPFLQEAFPTFITPGLCDTTLWSPILPLRGSNHNCKSLIAHVTICLMPVSPSRLSMPGKQCGSPSGLLLQGGWVTAGPSRCAHLHPPRCCTKASLPMGCSQPLIKVSTKCGSFLPDVGLLQYTTSLQGLPVHLAKTFSEPGCSPRLLLPCAPPCPLPFTSPSEVSPHPSSSLLFLSRRASAS